MTDAILHIGHHKTGSSYLQSMLSLNVQVLADHGIDYPYHPSFAGASAGHISSGNGDLLWQPDMRFSAGRTTLLSGELLFDRLAVGDALRNRVLSKVDRLKVVLYTRDVLDALVSRWGQLVKRGGETRSLDPWLLSAEDRMHERVLWWVAAARRLGFDLSLHNYTRNSQTLVAHFMRVLIPQGIDLGTLRLPPTGTVNRSLTEGETAVVRMLNGVSKELGSGASDELVNLLPGLPPARPRIARETYDAVVARFEPVVVRINAHLDPDERIAIGSDADFVRDGPAEEILSAEQTDIMSGVILRALMSRRPVNRVADLLRDTALRIERGEALGLGDALALMQMAQTLRPQGPLINDKIAEWSQQS